MLCLSSCRNMNTVSFMLPLTGRSPASAPCSSACPVHSEVPGVGPSLQRDLLLPFDHPSPEARIKVTDIYRLASRRTDLQHSLLTFITHLYDLPDFTLCLQFVQLQEGCPNRLVAPQETTVRWHTATTSPLESQHSKNILLIFSSDMNGSKVTSQQRWEKKQHISHLTR